MKFNPNEVSLLLKNNRFNDAIEYLDKFTEQNKNDSNYHFLKGFSYLTLQKLINATSSLSKAIAINSNNSTYYFYRGLVYFKLNKFKEAKIDYNKAISINPSSPEFYNNLGEINYTIGKNELALENFKKSFDLNNKLKPSILGLLKTLSQTENVKINNSKIISTHNKLNKINFNYSIDKHIKDSDIKDFLKKIDSFINSEIDNLELDTTQIFREQKTPPSCDRHHKIFNSYNAIPKFCFGCYKVQIDLENVIDLIKLYIVFDKVNFQNNNIRKCMIELRPKMKGQYKGLVFCNSIVEAENMSNMLQVILNKNFDKKIKFKIKRGCSEYAIKYQKYDSLETNAMTYNPDWEKYEKLIDEENPDLVFNKLTRPTISGVTLFDALIIRNWLAYAILIGDDSHKTISDRIFKSNFIEQKLRLKNS